MFPVQLNTPPVLPLSGLSTLQLAPFTPMDFVSAGEDMVHAWCMHSQGCAAPQDCAQLLASGQSRYQLLFRNGKASRNSGWPGDVLQRSQINSWNPCGGNAAHSENSTKRMIVSKLYDPKLIWKSGQNTQYEVTRSCLSKGA